MTPEEVREVNTAWGRRVAADKVWLLHTLTLTLGPAEEFFDGVEKVHVSDFNGEPVPSPVIKLATGDVLVAAPNEFIEVGPREVEYYVAASERMRVWMESAVKAAAQREMPAPTAVMLLTSLLRAQLRALEAQVPQPGVIR